MNLYYIILLNSQLGVREGKLKLCINGNSVEGNLFLLNFENPISGSRSLNKFCLKHNLKTATRVLCCKTVFEIDDGELSGSIETENAVMRLSGYAVSEEKYQCEEERI